MLEKVKDTAFLLVCGLSTLAKVVIIAQTQSKIAIISSTSLLGFLTPCIKLATNQIFDQLNWQPGSSRSFTEWSFSIISANLLAASATVGLGLAPSKLDALISAMLGIIFITESFFILSIGVNIYDIIDELRQGRNQPNPVVQLPQPTQTFPSSLFQVIRNVRANRLQYSSLANSATSINSSSTTSTHSNSTTQPQPQQIPVTVI